MKTKKAKTKAVLTSLNSSEGRNTRVHPDVLLAVKKLAMEEETTVWMIVNRSLIATLKKSRECPSTWVMSDS